MKREKRLKKGIESLHLQIQIHKERLNKAGQEGNEELVEYYKKDLTRLENEEKKKKDKLSD